MEKEQACTFALGNHENDVNKAETKIMIFYSIIFKNINQILDKLVILILKFKVYKHEFNLNLPIIWLF